MTDYVYCKIGSVNTTPTTDKTVKPVIACACTGKEVAGFIDEHKVPSYSGPLKSPIPFGWYYPNNEVGMTVSDAQIRRWVKQACEYHKIPHVLLALILQNENNPNASSGRKFLQFGERTATTALNITDKVLLDVVPDSWSKGSSGIANVSDKALNDGVKHSIENYARPPCTFFSR